MAGRAADVSFVLGDGGGAGKVEQVRALGLIQIQGAGDAFHALGRAGCPAAFKRGVVVNAGSGSNNVKVTFDLVLDGPTAAVLQAISGHAGHVYEESRGGADLRL